MTANVYTVLIDDARRPLPGQGNFGWSYNATGGDRGIIDSGPTADRFSNPIPGIYRAECVNGSSAGTPTFLGFWHALNRPIAQRREFRPQAIFDPLIRPEFQGRLLGLELEVAAIGSPGSRADLTLAAEWRGWDADGHEQIRHLSSVVGREALLNRPFPRTVWLPLDPNADAPIGLVNILLENATAGDVMAIGPVSLRVEIPTIDPTLEPFLFAYANLLNAYDARTGLVQDRANYVDGLVENISATGKFAKVIAAAVELGITDRLAGAAVVNQIASALLTRVPRGPAGLWPHFTTAGGTTISPGTEWASGDTAYALLDLTVALRMLDDPGHYLALCQERLNGIDWAVLFRPGVGYSHGYDERGAPLAGYWSGFGAETLGVNLAALAAGGPLAPMLAPASDNGSGFILHAAYPVAPTGIDRWGNDWGALRRAETLAQLSWYADPAHANSFLATRGWFGLSAAERPEASDPDHTGIYRAYGTGGRFAAPSDDNHSVATLHYSGCVAAIAPASSLAMWNSFKAAGLVSPMNFVESVAVNPSSGDLEHVNFLKGSWNLALFADGWAAAHERVNTSMLDAVHDIPSLASAWRTLFPEQSLAALAGTPSAAPLAGDRIAAGTDVPPPREGTPPAPIRRFTPARTEVAVVPKNRHRGSPEARDRA